MESRLGLKTDKLKFGKACEEDVNGVRMHIARAGYTGEDGFELSIPANEITAVAEELASGGAHTAGLAARDSLRLEAGMCLYGQDLGEEWSVVESALSWIVAKKRRENDAFIGASRVLADLAQGVTQRRVGLITEGAPARAGAVVVKDTQDVGTVTSGIPSPTLKKNIAMAYVPHGLHTPGTELSVRVRGRVQPASVVRLPFLPSRYVR